MEEYANQALDFLQLGFNRVNAIQGLLIALGAAYLLHEWRRLPVIALGAVFAHVAFSFLVAVAGQGGAIKLPPLVEPSYWRYLASLFVGYLFIVAVFFALKRMLMKAG